MTITSHIKKISVGVIAVALIAAAYLALTAPKAQAFTSIDNLAAGDLIRGETFSAVYYYGADGLRYVFPNIKTYNTWYSNFDNVKWLTDADLGRVQIGGNVTYKPGVRMIKINSDPKTYAVTRGGELRHVSTEAVAIATYGSNWNQMIDDVPDGFFTNYVIGDPITDASQYSAASETAAATSINWDKNLQAPSSVSITSAGYTPIDVTIAAGQSVRFTNNDTVKHTVTADDLSWGSGTINPGESFIRTFDETGTYGFFDSYNSSNSGAIYVQ